MKKEKRYRAAACVAAAIMLLLAGCGAKEQNTLTLYFATHNQEAFLEAMQEKFPEIQFEIYQYYGCNGSGFLRETIVNGDASDLVCYTQRVTADVAREQLLDLSGYGFTGNIDLATLHQYQIDGHIYQLPGPAAIRCMAYNKTMFEERGWSVPQNRKELLELIEEIRRDSPDTIPIVMALGGVGYPFTSVTTFSQAGFLATPSGAEWEMRYLEGNSSVREGWSEGIDMMAELIDAGAFQSAERFVGKWDDEVIRDCFMRGEAAIMFIWGGQQELIDAMEETDREIGLLPFFGYEDGQQVLGVTTGLNWAISRRLGEKGNERKLENALRVMEWLTTQEAQELMAASEAEIPTLKVVDMDGMGDTYKELWERCETAVKTPMVYGGYEDVIVEAGTLIQEHMLAGSSAGMKEELIRLVDERHAQSLRQSDVETKYGELAEDLSPEQAVWFMADVIASGAPADLALVTKGGSRDGVCNRNGVCGWLYAGAIDVTNYNILIPGGGTRCVDVLTLSGAEIKELLEQGRECVSEETESGADSAHWPYCWSGIDVELAGRHVRSVTLGGEPLSADQEYRVAFLNGDYPQTLAVGRVEETGVSAAELLKKYIGANSPVSAPRARR